MGMALDEPETNEQPVQVNGIDVLIEDIARPFIDGKTIDYTNEKHTEGFVINGDGESC